MEGPDLSLPDDLEGPVRDVVTFALASMHASVVLLDGGGMVEQASPAALADLDRTPDALVGRSIGELLGIGVGALVSADPLTSQRATTPEGTTVLWRAAALTRARVDGGWLVELLVAPGAERDPAGDLLERAERLEELLEELTERFEVLNRFSSLISHDLQAPTRRLLSFLELARDDLARGEDPSDRLAHVERGARHLLRLTTELLQYSRLGRRQILLDEVDADRVLAETLEQLSFELDAAGARVEVPEPLPHVVASDTFLSVVFQNLIENAVQYGREGVQPVVTVTWAREGDEVRIEVADNGVGIDPELWEAVFVPFRRLASGGDPQAGLGLATVRDLADRFGGSIRVLDSEVGRGTTFGLTLPAAP